jgi:hypothetical protein
MRRLLYNSVYLSWRLKLSEEQKKTAQAKSPCHTMVLLHNIRYNTIPWLKNEDSIWFFKCPALGPCSCAIHDFFLAGVAFLPMVFACLH